MGNFFFNSNSRVYKSYSDSKCVVEVSDSDPDPVNLWIQNLNLYDCDLQSLQPNKDVTENVINASQKLLKDQFGICGFQNTALAHSLKFSRAPTDKLCVQVLHTGTVYYTVVSLGQMNCTGIVYTGVSLGQMNCTGIVYTGVSLGQVRYCLYWGFF